MLKLKNYLKTHDYGNEEEVNKLYKLFPKEILDNLENIISGRLPEDIFTNNGEIISKFRMIPFSSLGMQNGLLLGIKVDKIEIFLDDDEEIINNVIIGIYNNKLSKNEEYAVLIRFVKATGKKY